ncbi:hypothetical protein B0O80DRAFT_457208 [Mortierella sp. GBAus27b]|nr:hypothetical protein BGX31_008815 [Mortierella sp. GBA43]KAI8350664.1 hypothetical protein B0O80DRAFT_457208 [Mortierella sp. GBAus27b]
MSTVAPTHKPTTATTPGKPASTTVRKPTTATTGLPTTSAVSRTAGRPTTTTRTHVEPTTPPSISASPESGPQPQNGLSAGAIGGIAAGAVFLVALVGFVFFKRRRRTVADSKEGSEPKYMNAGNYSKKKKGPHDNGISGPLALAPETEVPPELLIPPTSSLSPPPRHQQQARHQQPIRSGSNGLNDSRSTLNSNKVGKEPETAKRGDAYHDDHPNGYYDEGFVHDYYGAPSEPIGAQQSRTQLRDNSHGNLTPAPDYYLGKEDIDPRRDLRGLDQPDTYIRASQMTPSAPPPQKPSPQEDMDMDSPRSSCSSEGGYMTLEQAQKAHLHKMMGHKESIGSESVLAEKYGEINMLQISSSVSSPSVPYRQQAQSNLTQGTPTFVPEHASIAISDSTMSMMPSLPSVTSPQPFTPRGKVSQDIPMGAHAGQGSGPITYSGRPSFSDSPYADGADYRDNRSYGPGTPRNDYYGDASGPGRAYPSPGQYGHPNARGYSPSSPGPYYQQGSGYRPNGSGPGYGMSPPYNNGYGGGRQPGYASPNPSRGPPNFTPQNGHPTRVMSPGPTGYRPQYPHHEPSYHQGPYSSAY